MRLATLPLPLLAIMLSAPSTYATAWTTIIRAGALIGTAAAVSSQYTSDTDFQSAVVAAHNFYREEHNATALVWNATSATAGLKVAEPCVFKHSGGPTGENLAAGYPNVTASVDAWGGERTQYDFSKGQFGENTGHFTQVVWKATTSVGCGRKECDGSNGTPGWYLVCEYYPPGNVVGAFKENVQAQVKGSSTGGVEGGLGNKGAMLFASSGAIVAVLIAAFGFARVLW